LKPVDRGHQGVPLSVRLLLYDAALAFVLAVGDNSVPPEYLRPDTDVSRFDMCWL
jgi:hypothetical protein